MNDRQNPYDPYGQQPQIIGYDAYGQPVYQQPEQQGCDPYASPQDPYSYGQPTQGQPPQDPYQQGQQAQGRQDGAGQGYGYDPYAQQQNQSYDPYAGHPQQPRPQQPQGGEQGYGYGGGYGYDTGQQPVVVDATAQQQWNVPQQNVAAPHAAPPQPAPPYSGDSGDQRTASRAAPQTDAPVRGPEPESGVPEQRRSSQDYRTGQFSFIEEPDEDSEDVIDWLAFTESRSERREEARRKGRNRLIGLIVVVALVVVAGVGYLWTAGKLPGSSGADGKAATAGGPQQRDVIVVHLHNTKGGGTSTALLVDNVTTKKGTTVLLPNSLAVANDDGSTTTLGESVEDDGSTGTREAIDTLLGTKISGTWRLDTPYLENLVELVGNIEVDTDTDVPDAKKGAAPVVRKGEAQTLSGTMAVAYATYRAKGEPEAKQLNRFGQVLRGVLRKLSEDPKAATITVQTLAQILDPSLPEADLGASLAKLAGHAKVGDYTTEVLPVQDDGTLSDAATKSVVKDILGGSVRAPDKDAATRVGVKNAYGDTDALDAARVVLVNGGYSFVDAGKADTRSTSEIVYGAAEDKDKAVEVAKTLGLPESVVTKGEAAANADVSVVLGQDYVFQKAKS
ncbi:LCP family protein [Streptomyces sp. NBC_00102]|uniref:LCP family protein n=1 Tax=Streptomyces sp. NBC_00102 TaxID=2975652 RepID=UPI0022534C19|nr:LCP family protein [Streptomyces sp. NBC_00102]MCX5396977.1 LCP family protein [Streptomyces sp. NBC_00102]